MEGSGKPRACHNCKKRKLKCDYRKPACLRCEKTQVACKGYQRETVFINQTPGQVSTTGLLVPKHVNSSPITPSYDDYLQGLKLQLQNPSGSRPHFRGQSLELLKKLYLPQLSLVNTGNSSIFTWLPAVCDLQGLSHALDQSLYAFCVIQVAITKSASIGVDEALQTYYDTLQTLKVELEDQAAAQKDEILAAISVLSTCELFVCPTDHAWQAHAQGISEILRIRDDLDFSNPIQRSFSFRIRIILLFEALTKRLSRPMASSHFKKLMSTKKEQDPLIELSNVAWAVPAVLEESDILMASSNTIPEEMRINAFKSSLEVIDRLHDCQQQYRDDLAKPPYWAMPSTANNPADEFYDSKLFPFALQFQSMEIATYMILYWGILLQIHCSMLDLYLHFFGSTIFSPTFDLPDSDNLTKPLLNARFPTMTSIKDEADTLARYLCQSIEYCYSLKNGTVGPQMTCYAQWILKLYFRNLHYERQLAWCLNIKNMSGPGFHHGIELMCF